MTRLIFALPDPNIRDHLIALRDSALSEGLLEDSEAKPTCHSSRTRWFPTSEMPLREYISRMPASERCHA
jgi:hypothetical protein